jgi:hypothetical protein
MNLVSAVCRPAGHKIINILCSRGSRKLSVKNLSFCIHGFIWYAQYVHEIKLCLCTCLVCRIKQCVFAYLPNTRDKTLFSLRTGHYTVCIFDKYMNWKGEYQTHLFQQFKTLVKISLRINPKRMKGFTGGKWLRGKIS